jgi:hypothetical protein
MLTSIQLSSVFLFCPAPAAGGSDFLLQVKKSAKTPPLCRLRLKWHSTMPAPLNSLRSNSTGAFTSHQDTHGFKPFFNGAFAKAERLNSWRSSGQFACRKNKESSWLPLID